MPVGRAMSHTPAPKHGVRCTHTHSHTQCTYWCVRYVATRSVNPEGTFSSGHSSQCATWTQRAGERASESIERSGTLVHERACVGG
jgi:hypothetical protein